MSIVPDARNVASQMTGSCPFCHSRRHVPVRRNPEPPPPRPHHRESTAVVVHGGADLRKRIKAIA
ncbi:hypothetical protein T261_5909 [Streptomyces lydicus]|nr:hypothetical protein T261_5909 [Streptomyces lydicus]